MPLTAPILLDLALHRWRIRIFDLHPMRRHPRRREAADGHRKSGPAGWVATLDWRDKLIQSEQVGGRAHEAQSIRLVWSCGGAAYRNGGANAFSRDAFRRRRWQFEVLRQRRN